MLMVLGGVTLHNMWEGVAILMGRMTSDRIPQNNAFQDASRCYPQPANVIVILGDATLHKIEEDVSSLMAERTSSRMPPRSFKKPSKASQNRSEVHDPDLCANSGREKDFEPDPLKLILMPSKKPQGAIQSQPMPS